MSRQKQYQGLLKDLDAPQCPNCKEYYESTRDTHAWCETCKRCVYPKHEGKPCSEVK